MTAWNALSRRRKLAVVALAIALLLAFLPLRVVLDLGGAGGKGIAARQVRGSIWQGRIDDLSFGPVSLGDMKAAVAPGPLLLGRIRLDLEQEGKEQGGGAALRGAWISGFNRKGIADVNGSMATGSGLSALPITALEWDGVTVEFAGDICARAEGRLRIRLGGSYGGLNLSQGLSGPATCDGGAVLFALVSQTGMESLSLRVSRDGRYQARLMIKGVDPEKGEALRAVGLKAQGDGYGIAMDGRIG